MEHAAYSLNSSSISLSTSDQKHIQHLKSIISQINLYLGILIFIFGILGNLLNILILSQRTLRSNTCVMIFLANSIAGIITFLSGLTPRILSTWNMDISDNVQWICKFHNFLVYTFRLVTFWLIMLATIDRWIVSSRNPRFRQLSSSKNVLRCIFFLILLSIIIHCQVLYCYEANLPNTPIKCFNKNPTCRLANDLIFAIVTIFLPIILSAIFGSMTALRIRSNQNRILPSATVSLIEALPQIPDSIRQRRRVFKKIDRHIFIMLVIQVILLAFLTFPMAIQKLYATFTIHVNKSDLRITIESFTYQITLLMIYIAIGMQFYVNTLSGGNVFRKATIDLLKNIIRKIMCRY